MEQKDMLLIAGGSLKSRDLLRSVLQERYHLLEATNTRQMLLLLEQNLTQITALILDISNMAAIDEELVQAAPSVQLLRQIPIIIVTNKENYRDLTLYFRYGATDVIPLNYDPYAMLRRVENITQLVSYSKHLNSVVAEQKEQLHHFSDNMVDVLSSVIEYRNMESGHHILRIRNFTRILMEEVMRHCPEYGLTDGIVSVISSASALHDVGKIGIPDAILTKPGPLTADEWEVMKTHSILGCELLENLGTTVDKEYLLYARNICRYHHERWDGKGYPDGLAGDDIPLCAQVVGLTDCYDALTARRVYKEAYPHVQAVNMILSGECGAFSPQLLECFKNVTDRFAELRQKYADLPAAPEESTDFTLAPLDYGQPANLLEKTRAKYYCLVHYISGFLVEIQLDTGLFQVIYNPYPELAQVHGAHTLRDLADIAACSVVLPEEQERMYAALRQELPRFIEADLRRQSFYFHHQPYGNEPSGEFEMTFLRIGGVNRRPSLAILCRKIYHHGESVMTQQALLGNFVDCTYVCRNDNGFTLVQVGRDTRSLGGYTPQEVMDLFGGRLLDMAFPEDRAAIRAEFDRQLRESPMVRTEYRFLCKDGSVGWVVNKSRLVLAEDGQEYIQTFLMDISDIKAAHSRTEETLNRYQIILAQTENVLFDLDIASLSIDFSDTWERIFGYLPSRSKFDKQLSGETHVHPDDIPVLKDHLLRMQQGSNYELVEIRIATADGRYLWCRVRGSALRDKNGSLTRVMGVIINIDAEHQALEALEDRANRDSLTNLLHKEAGRQLAERYLSQRRDASCALLILDLDNFKELNDRYGHLFGDALLTRVSRVLTNLFHSQDIIARIGGDEFLVLVRGISDRQLLTAKCRRLRDTLLQSLQDSPAELALSCSVGIALCPEHGTDYYGLFSKADYALYQAKTEGKAGFCFYGDTIGSQRISARRSITPIDSDNELFLTQEDITYQVCRIFCETEDFNTAVTQALALVGQRVNVGRVSIFENKATGKGGLNTFEWRREDMPAPSKMILREISVPYYEDRFDDDGVFYCHDVRELPSEDRALAEQAGVKAMLQCAIRRDGRFVGSIGFDDCMNYRLWTQAEIRLLSQFSKILALFLLKHREQHPAEG